jgi:hypothetical protein
MTRVDCVRPSFPSRKITGILKLIVRTCTLSVLSYSTMMSLTTNFKKSFLSSSDKSCLSLTSSLNLSNQPNHSSSFPICSSELRSSF